MSKAKTSPLTPREAHNIIYNLGYAIATEIISVEEARQISSTTTTASAHNITSEIVYNPLLGESPPTTTFPFFEIERNS